MTETEQDSWLRRARALAALGSEPGLDAAWAEVEAALPEGYRIEGVSLVDTSDSENLDDERLEWEAEASGDRGQRSITALGPTATAALRALAARLRGGQE